MSEMPVLPTPVEARPPAAPPVPGNLRDTGLSAEAVIDLLLKTMYLQGAKTGQQLTEEVRLPFSLLDDLLLSLQQRMLVEVRGTRGHSRGGYVFDLTGSGRDRAREALGSSQYVGPAPVPLDQFRHWIALQSIRNVRITRDRLREGFRDVVMGDDLFDRLGPAVNAARSLFLHGEPGNGKTLIAEAIARMVGGAIYLPYAIDVNGHTLVVHDPVYHRPAPGPAPGTVPGGGPEWLRREPEHDARFARVSRPLVITGGELTLDQLDLQYDPHTKLYQAPFQLKACGGILIIDDFGRQRVPAADLLNRWIVPLEKSVDFLTLHTGAKFPVPFDCMLVFSTNLAPDQLVDEAFLRRIQYKIHVPDPTRERYDEIFRRCCAERGIAFDAGAVDYIYREYYGARGFPTRACHPRDLLDHLIAAATFFDRPPELSEELIDHACQTYFLGMAAGKEGTPAGGR
ncbi:MAG TPA: hypothetical protein VF212_11545 [Longimicrobiales bacterium]